MRLIIIVSVFIASCSAGIDNRSAKTSRSANSQYAITTQIKNASDYDHLIGNEDWLLYETSGNKDTALALFAYRLAALGTSDFVDYASHTRLYLEYNSCEDLISRLFSNDNELSEKFLAIQSINESYKSYAIEDVQKDLNEFGQSDGPYYSFLRSIGEIE